MTLKSFCTAKKTLNKMKDNPQNGKKMFANNASSKELIF